MNERYLQYLKSKDWSAKRKVRLNATDAKCDICGTLNWSNDVHHVKYAKDLEQVKLWDLKVLCRRCHNAVHVALNKRKDEINRPQQSLIRWNRTLRIIIELELLPQSELNKIRKKLNIPTAHIPHDPRLSTRECDEWKPIPKSHKKKPKREKVRQKDIRRKKMAANKARKKEIEEINAKIENGQRVII